jgi:hypothetical protein
MAVSTVFPIGSTCNDRELAGETFSLGAPFGASMVSAYNPVSALPFPTSIHVHTSSR